MAHYAFINQDNIVVSVIVGLDETETQLDTNGSIIGGSSEAWELFYASQPWHTGLVCKRTSYNTSNGIHNKGGVPFRGNYAGIGYTYNALHDIFIYPKPFASWVLNIITCSWDAPVANPSVGFWTWDEATVSWVEIPPD